MTDKAKRHEKRVKVIARKDKKEARKAEKQAKIAKSFDPDAAASKFETVPREAPDMDRESGSEAEDEKLIGSYPDTPKGRRMRKKAEKEVTDAARRERNEKKGRALISAGMGKSHEGGKSEEGCEVRCPSRVFQFRMIFGLLNVRLSVSLKNNHWSI
jgi:hypothetical protein